MISKEEVKKIAELARLEIGEKEIDKFQKDFSSILKYVDKLKELDVSDLRETAFAIELKNIFREDKGYVSDGSNRQSLIRDEQDGYLKVKKILND